MPLAAQARRPRRRAYPSASSSLFDRLCAPARHAAAQDGKKKDDVADGRSAPSPHRAWRRLSEARSRHHDGQKAHGLDSADAGLMTAYCFLSFLMSALYIGFFRHDARHMLFVTFFCRLLHGHAGGFWEMTTA